MKCVWTVLAARLIPATRMLLFVVVIGVFLILAILITVPPTTTWPKLALAVPFISSTLRDIDLPVTALSRVTSGAFFINEHCLEREVVADGSLMMKQ